jgi:hypothetical protein
MSLFDFQHAESAQPRVHAWYDRNRYFAHHKKDAHPVQPVYTPRDNLLLKILLSYRVLDSKSLFLLARFDADKSAFYRRCRKLFRAGILDRCEQADYLNYRHLEPGVVWALGPEGYKLLSQDPDLNLPLDHRRQDERWTQKNTEIKPSNLLHDLTSNRGRAAIELATYAHPRVRLLYWQSRPEDLAFKVPVPERQISLLKIPQKVVTVKPDGSFGLHHITEQEPNQAHFYWEWDRGSTELDGRWLWKKGFGYGELYRTGLCSRLRGFNFFNALNIAPSETRRENMRKTVDSWLHKAKHQGFEYPPNLWLFSEAQHFRVDEPRAAVEARIWWSVGEEKPVSLLEV